ncbi:DUF481 domain-containing protein [Sulfurimonas sp. CVO]|uniref:DUF481 domain-containing protein n=1 Tax=Sulfurimonas sp. CVO TaxID=2283483 RepID=UPI00132EF82A|nr:DUF481 domain-containing protein [Sulfurimonas sp. CVO]QHG92000.1 DUF481 domain-containing protein [Sulfurimonas sp. CVO]
MKFYLLITLITTQYLFALVSIAPVEIGEKPGFSNSIETSLETTRGNTDTDSYKASLRTTYDNNTSYIVWAEVSGAYGKASGEENTNKLFSHIRYIHALTDETLRAELFAQLQNDKFRQINSRALGGAGLRFKLFDLLKNGKGYFGAGIFYENIRYENPIIDPTEDNVRVNSYFSYAIEFNKTSSAAYTLYYQPKVDDFSDNVQSHELELKLNIYQNLFLKFSLSYNTDSEPPLGVKKYDFTQNTSFIFNF